MPSEAIRQSDGKNYAIVVHFPGGRLTPANLDNLAHIARTLQIPLIKMTSGQRSLLAGIPQHNLPAVWSDLGMDETQARAPCVKFVHTCAGIDWCMYSAGGPVSLSREIEELTARTEFPAKVKIGVSGCFRNCSAGFFRDIGLFAN